MVQNIRDAGDKYEGMVGKMGRVKRMRLWRKSYLVQGVFTPFYTLKSSSMENLG